MATTFLEPGGDANFLVANTTGGGFWKTVYAIGSTPVVATDFVHGAHIKSIKIVTASTAAGMDTPTGVLADAGSRVSFYVYFNTLPSADRTLFSPRTSAGAEVIGIRVTAGGVLRLMNVNTQIGTDGATLSTGTWYRISLAYTITDTTHNRFELFVDGASSISVTNGTLARTATSLFQFVTGGSVTVDLRLSDIYIDNSSSLTDTGNIWVTAKRPNADGTTNGFTTQIGAGGSGYGSGHSPQVNERALSVTNGWSMVGAGSAVTEEYTIESAATGDINISADTIVDYGGWLYQKALVSETATMITGGTNSTYATGTANNMVTSFKGSTTYPAGGTNIGVITSTDLTTFSLYECGIIVAYIPAGVTQPPYVNSKNKGTLAFMGTG